MKPSILVIVYFLYRHKYLKCHAVSLKKRKAQEKQTLTISIGVDTFHFVIRSHDCLIYLNRCETVILCWCRIIALMTSYITWWTTLQSFLFMSYFPWSFTKNNRCTYSNLMLLMMMGYFFINTEYRCNLTETKKEDIWGFES